MDGKRRPRKPRLRWKDEEKSRGKSEGGSENKGRMEMELETFAL